MPSFDTRIAFLLSVALGCGSVMPSATCAQGEAGSGDLERRLAELRSELEVLEKEVRAESQETGEGATASQEPDTRFTPFWSREELDRPGPVRGVYDKPFLMSLWRRAHIGGYAELEFHSFEDGIQSIPRGFRMHRTNLFLFTELTERLHFGSEIEFETEFDGVTNSSEIEVALEMAFLDYKIFEELIIRGGAILVPLGRINVNHDGPVREFTERPLVSTYVIPTTLTEAGVGVVGAFELSDSLSISYQAYAVNGFDVLAADGTLAAPITRQEILLREGRSSLGGDVNDGVASTGRLALGFTGSSASPLPGDPGSAPSGRSDVFLEVGGSWHAGTYDEHGDNFLTIVAADLALVYGMFSLEGEIALADFSRDVFATTSGVPDRFWGYYVQASAGGMPRVLRETVPYLFDDPGARVSMGLRFDWIDLDGDRGTVIEPGINFRPTADTVFKLSYRFAPNSFGIRSTPPTEEFDDEGFVFSLTTYF